MTEKEQNKSNCCSCILILVIIGFLAVLAPIYYVYMNLRYTAPASAQIDILEGDGNENISQKLAAKKIISSDLFFQMYTFYTNDFQLFQPGSYYIPAGSDINQVISILVTPEESDISLTFPEGITNDQIISKISTNTNVTADELTAELSKLSTSSQLPIKTPGTDQKLEGFLFPDTYVFAKDSNASEIINKLLDNFKTKWKTTKNNQTELSDYDILILASIIEKEAANQSERRIISGILHDRLKYNIYLGVNSTINYILDEPQAFFRSGENTIDSPYNTYLNYGLPPTPICNPGLDSIEAALNPEFTDYVYYLHTPDGEIIYSKTLEEHNANITKYY